MQLSFELEQVVFGLLEQVLFGFFEQVLFGLLGALVNVRSDIARGQGVPEFHRAESRWSCIW